MPHQLMGHFDLLGTSIFLMSSKSSNDIENAKIAVRAYSQN